jgi:hypothetical protein
MILAEVPHLLSLLPSRSHGCGGRSWDRATMTTSVNLSQFLSGSIPRSPAYLSSPHPRSPAYLSSPHSPRTRMLTLNNGPYSLAAPPPRPGRDEVFALFDVDRSGELDYTEIRALLAERQIVVDEKTFTQVMSHYDQDSSGGISETEFEGMYRLRHRPTRTGILHWLRFTYVFENRSA